MKLREWLTSTRNDFKALEPVLVDGFSTLSPWLSAVYPAALTGWNVAHYLTNGWGFLQYPVAVLAAAAVEALGISSTHTAIKEWAKGRNTSAGLFRLAIASGLHYLAAVIAVNVVLEANYVGDWPKIVANAILSTMTVTGALVIAIRAQGAENELDREKKKDERKAERNSQSRVSQSPAIANERNPQGETQAAKHGGETRPAIPAQPRPAKGQARAAILALIEKYPNRTNAEYAAALGIHPAQVTRAKKEMK